jgi:hypothetical protein
VDRRQEPPPPAAARADQHVHQPHPPQPCGPRVALARAQARRRKRSPKRKPRSRRVAAPTGRCSPRACTRLPRAPPPRGGRSSAIARCNCSRNWSRRDGSMRASCATIPTSRPFATANPSSAWSVPSNLVAD